ncbi:hypothetical protein M153_10437000854, partial [Pseudoloma neurophilia]
LSRDTQSRDQVMLSSAGKETRCEDDGRFELYEVDQKNYNKFRKTRFSINLPGTALQVRQSLYRLDNIGQNLFKFIQNLRTTAEECQWSNEETKLTLLGLINSEIKEKIKDKSDVETIVQEIMSMKYKVEDQRKFEEKLDQIKQENFKKIEDYQYHIDETIARLALCRKSTKTEIESLKERQFFKGLHKQCRLKLLEANVHTSQDAINYIKRIEDECTSTEHNKIEKSPKLNKYWCSVCRKHTHNTENCFSRKRTDSHTKDTTNQQMSNNNMEKQKSIKKSNTKI